MRFETCSDCNWGFIGCSENVQEMIDSHECSCKHELILEDELVAV